MPKLVAAYNALQWNKLQVLNEQVVAAEVVPEINVNGPQLQGDEMMEEKEDSSKVIRHVFTRVFMQKKVDQWLVKERNSDTDTDCFTHHTSYFSRCPRHSNPD